MLDAPNLDKKIVTFMGPEGSGKSTLAKRLAGSTQKPYISTGDIIRDLSENDKGPIGDECRAMFKEKRYLDPKMLLQILDERYRREDMANGFVVDGGLRTVTETEAYPEFLKCVRRDFPMAVVHLQIPDQLGIDRILKRGRDSNDTLGGILSRLAKYHFQLEERLVLIRQTPNWNLIIVDATGAIDQTYQKLCAAIKSNL